MTIAQLLSGLATLFWVGLFFYIVYVVSQRSRGRGAKISVTLTVILLGLALVATTLGASVITVDAGEAGVVFNVFSGTQQTTLAPGLHVLVPYLNQVYRYPTTEQAYTMSIQAHEGKIKGDDSLWSPTIEGLQVGIDSTTRYAVDPARAWMVHNKFRSFERIEEVLIRPSIRSMVRLHVSQFTVTDVYGPKRAQIQRNIESDIRKRFEDEGVILLSFDIRNVNFTDDYRKAIEQKQIAQQQAEQMQFVLAKEKAEAERKKIEAEGIKQAAITKAQGEAESLHLINEQIAKNADLLLYRYIEKLAPNVQVMYLPSNTPLLLNLESLKGAAKESK